MSGTTTSDQAAPRPTMGRLDRAAARVLAGALGLPPAVQRLLVGRRVVVDGQALDLDVQMLLRLQRLGREPDLGNRSPTVGRAQMLRQTRLVGGRWPVGQVDDLLAGGLPARLYVPAGAAERTALLVFLHGGGFMYGDLDSHDAPCRFLAERTGARVLAVDYRLAPEHPFPAAYDDALTAFRWAVEHAGDLGAEPDRIGVGGDSAGGNLAAGVALAAAREGLPCAVQMLVYPVTARQRDSRSARLFGSGFLLTSQFIELADRSYLAGADRHDVRYAPLTADLPPDVARSMAPALVYTAGFDPLRDEGEAYAEKLREAGVPTVMRRFTGQMHGFLNLVGVGVSPVSATTLIAADLRSALAGEPASAPPVPIGDDT